MPKHLISPAKGKRREKREEPRLDIFLVKLNGELKIEGGGNKPNENSLIFVNDISQTGIGVFLEHPIPSHTNVVINIKRPEPMTIKGRISWCNKFNFSSKVITSSQFVYRAGVKFIFANDKEKTDLAKLIMHLKEILAETL